MTAKPVEWVLVVYYGPSAHRATYGRNVREPAGSAKYTKDYIQLSRKADFLDAVKQIFPFATGTEGAVELEYRWPTGSSEGALTWSADRPHLKWETSLGAPAAWKMTPSPTDTSAETIPGDPEHTALEDAERELEMLAARGAGQPYLIAVKLRDEPSTLHLRAYLEGASQEFQWADIALTPPLVQDLIQKTSAKSALAWSLFHSGGEPPSAETENFLHSLVHEEDINSVLSTVDMPTGQKLAAYLQSPGYGIFFDPSKNHDAWIQPGPLPGDVISSAASLLMELVERFPNAPLGDALAETAESDPEEVEELQRQLDEKNYAVPDSTATRKTRGSAQRVFANSVKKNYGHRCAVTGITTKEFLVAAHIVPWGEDQSIRLDPSNGICLSLIVDKAFEEGFLVIEDDLTIRVARERMKEDVALLSLLEPHDGKKLNAPASAPPTPEYLKRRRHLVGHGES